MSSYKETNELLQCQLFKNMYICVLKIYIDRKRRQRQDEGVDELQGENMLVYSPNGHNNQEWARLKLETASWSPR